jgi:glycosyltransferase involved in cell wall biosynthesis
MFSTVSVVIIARDEGAHIAETVRAVATQGVAGCEIEILVVDDSSVDDTAAEAQRAGATVVAAGEPGAKGNPARARNLGAWRSRGDPIVFLDADCRPAAGWLSALLAVHARGVTVVGGGIALAPGLSYVARCDYYCGCYLTHPTRPAGWVPHHPPNNLSVRRTPFLGTAGYTERAPLDYTNEERHWQAALRAQGMRIRFEPSAFVYHKNRPGLRNLLLRHFRWAYTALEAKAETQSARHAWLYRFPPALVVLSVPYCLLQTVYIVGCWLRAGRLEPVAMLPLILLSRLAYAAGMCVGGAEYLRRKRNPSRPSRKEWPSERAK